VQDTSRVYMQALPGAPVIATRTAAGDERDPPLREDVGLPCTLFRMLAIFSSCILEFQTRKWLSRVGASEAECIYVARFGCGA
jgi:hypothetical protein